MQLIGRGTYPDDHPLAGQLLFPDPNASVATLAGGPDFKFDVDLFASDGLEQASIDIDIGAISAA